GAKADGTAIDATDTSQITVPVLAAPRRALGQQVSSVTVVQKPATSNVAAEAVTGAGAPAEPVPLPETVAAQLDAISDDLTQIRGVSKATAEELNAAGVYRFSQIANWTAGEVKVMRATLSAGALISKQNWIEQAALRAGERKSGPVPSGARAELAALPVAVPVPKSETRPAAVDHAELQAGVDTEAPLPLQAKPRKLPLPRFTQAAAAVGIAAVGQNDTEVVPEKPEPKSPASTPSSAKSDAPAQTLPTPARTPAEPIADLMALGGMTPETARKLRALGITGTDQIAAWTSNDIADFQIALGDTPNIRRANWLAQAALLQSGVVTSYEAKRRAGVFDARVSPPRDVAWPPRLESEIDAYRPPLEDDDELHDDFTSGEDFESDVSIVVRSAEVPPAERPPTPPPLTARLASPPQSPTQPQRSPPTPPAFARTSSPRPKPPPPIPPALAVPTPSLPELLPMPEPRAETPRPSGDSAARIDLPPPNAESLLDRDDTHADVMIVRRDDDTATDATASANVGSAPDHDARTRPPEPEAEPPLAERLTDRLRSVTPRKRTKRKPTLRQNYSLSPEEASVQIVSAPEVPPSDDENTVDGAAEPASGEPEETTPAPSAPSSETASPSRARAQRGRFIRALSGNSR
ncbi:MAG: hypothetical protein AAFZ05_13910, partial [Pseudomonadota bacterium]